MKNSRRDVADRRPAPVVQRLANTPDRVTRSIVIGVVAKALKGGGPVAPSEIVRELHYLFSKSGRKVSREEIAALVTAALAAKEALAKGARPDQP